MRRHARAGARIGALVLLFSFGFPGFPGTAHAAHVQCDTVITESGTTVTLDSDVGPCTTDGIIIRADNVTINLNGFDVVGDSNPATQNVGIRVFGTQNTITDCDPTSQGQPACTPGRPDSLVRDFNTGVAFFGGASNEVCRITLQRNIGSPGGPIGEGIRIESSNANTVANTTVQGNGPYAGVHVREDSDGNKIGTPISGDIDGASERTTCDGGNTIRDNNIPHGPMEDIGIRLEAGSEYPNSNEVRNNLVAGNGLDGISAFFPAVSYTGATDNHIVSNTVENNGFHVIPHRNGDGIRLNGNRRVREVGANNVTVEGNIVRNNAAAGITARSQSNQIKGNTVTGNGSQADNPATPGYDPTHPASTTVGHGINIQNDKNVVTNDNQVSGNHEDGISLLRNAAENQITQNTVTGHVRGNGIRTWTGSLNNHIVKNTSTGNAQFDLREDNPNADPVPPCETNLWQSNQEVTKNQACID